MPNIDILCQHFHYLEISPLSFYSSSDEVINSYTDLLNRTGGIPILSSPLKDTYYAIKSMDILRSKEEFSVPQITEFILNHYDSDKKGFICDEGNYTTLEANFYGIEGLSLLDQNISETIKSDISDYILNISNDLTYFLDFNHSYGEIFTSYMHDNFGQTQLQNGSILILAIG